MQSFLKETWNFIKKKHDDVSSLVFILPSKRAGNFLRKAILENSQETFFLPKIYSIEEFIEILSDLKICKSTFLLFEFYEVYKTLFQNKEKEDFETFSSWATTLLNDFNEIDRYLVDEKSFFNYLKEIQDINHWYLQNEKTDLIENYISFFNDLPSYYKQLQNTLRLKGEGYQGMVYKEAAENMEHYVNIHGNKNHVFIGFNALNNAEQHIIQELLETGNTDVFWDADSYFIEDTKHSASLFLRDYFNTWNYYEETAPLKISNNFSLNKSIEITEAPNNIEQVKHVGSLLANFSEEKIQNTAIVLADENLLIPLLNSLPENVKEANITMGVSLKALPLTRFFSTLIDLHTQEKERIYYKDVFKILKFPASRQLISTSQEIINAIVKQNIKSVSLSQLVTLAGLENENTIKLLFNSWENSSEKALDTCLELLLNFKKTDDLLQRTCAHNLYELFSSIFVLQTKYAHLKTVKSVLALFKELLSTSTLDFKGDAYQGLQIMGVLETRVLDFKTVIMLSVNEGVIPSGKSNASFITYDMKIQYKLPSYLEKDAIYTYHFYRLLHRASSIYLLYNSVGEGLQTQEKSRLIQQLIVEKCENHNIKTSIVSPPVLPLKKETIIIEKSSEVIKRIQEVASKGFSPSSLTSYIRNPLDFYYQKVLRVKEYNELEETVALNTLGTIIHDTLQELYEPLKGGFLSVDILKGLLKLIEEQVAFQFNKSFKKGNVKLGKNRIIFEVAKRYISNFIQFEIRELKSGKEIKILEIEKDLRLSISIPDLGFPVFIHGKVDRVDEINGTLRIIDYKTGFVKQTDLEIIDWNDITEDYKYSKAFQVLAYALMLDGNKAITTTSAGIISFKNLASGFLKFAIKESSNSRKKDFGVNQEILTSFTIELKKLILEICNPTIPFTEKEI